MTEEEFRDLQERVHLIEEMAETPGWGMLLDRARATLLARQTRIVQGKCEDYENYIKETSFGDGIEYVMRLPFKVREELELAAEIRFPEEPDEPE